MEKFVKRNAKERFAPLAIATTSTVAMFTGAITLGNMAEKAAKEDKKSKAAILSTASQILRWGSYLTGIFVVPDTVGNALKAEKPSPEYCSAVNRVVETANAKVAQAEADYQARVAEITNEANASLDAL